MEGSDWIAIGAVLVSFIALGVSIYEAVSNKPRLRVSAHPSLVLETGEKVLTVVVVNYGRQPTMITHVSVLKRNLRGSIAASGTGTLPHLLDVGRVATFRLPMRVQSDDPLNIGTSTTLEEFLASGECQVEVRDSWHEKPHRALIR